MKKVLFPFLFLACTILLMSACRTVRGTEKETVAKGSSETSHSESLQTASFLSVLNALSMRADSIVIWMQDGGAGSDRQLYPAAISTENGDFTAQSSDLLYPGICPDDDSKGVSPYVKANGRVSDNIQPSCRKRYRPPENTDNNRNADCNSNAGKGNSPVTSSRYRGISKIVLAGLQLDAKTESVRSYSLSATDSTRVADSHEEQKSSASKSSTALFSMTNILFCIIIVILAMIVAKWLWQKRKNKS